MNKFGIAIILAIVLLVAGVLAFDRFGTNSRSNNMLATAAGTERLPDNFIPPIVKAKHRYKLGVSFPFLAAPFWVNEAYGIMDQAKKDGVDITWYSADGYDHIEKQNAQLEDLITLKVDAILLAATSYDGTVPAVNHAVASGIPVLTHVTSSNTPRISAAVLTDDVAIGEKQGAYMCSELKSHGTVAMLDGPAAADWSSNRVKGFKTTLASKCPRVQVVSEKFGVPDRSDAQRLASDLFVTFPNLNGVFTVADGMALGVVDAAKAAGRLGTVTITTASFSREAVPYIQSGAIGVDVDESPLVTGRMIVNRAVELLNAQGRIPNTTYVPIPAWTKSNVNDAPQAHWAPSGWSIQ